MPPICSNLYSFLGELNVHVVFNEVQRQFSMPYKTDTLIDQYTSYTYPYEMRYHIDDIKNKLLRGKLVALFTMFKTSAIDIYMTACSRTY